MIRLVEELKKKIARGLQEIYGYEADINKILINETKEEFEGDFTFVTFSLSKELGKNPPLIAEEMGRYLQENDTDISSYNVIKGFLNLSLSNDYITLIINKLNKLNFKPYFPVRNEKIMVEYSSPNTNKPLHLGHLRNIFLGDSVARIYGYYGFGVCRANLINDRGIHICKSMIAWKKFADNASPESENLKGDHFVGKYYVLFNEVYKKEIEQLKEQGLTDEEAKNKAPIFLEAQEMLRKWEEGDPDILALWKKMNQWVYNGFDKTYQDLGIEFDRYYYESQTYLLGKDLVKEGLKEKVFYEKEDHSVWINLESEGLDEKIVQRADGTSVYITQDMGTAQLKYGDEQMSRSVYVIADEQNYHMKVLKLILQKLGKDYAEGIYHLSYGMVELPDGKMKSREGTVVDADDIVREMIGIAARNTEELGKVEGFSEEALNILYRDIGLGALKFYLLRVDPKKRIVFNPEESIDFHGYTGPFIQYTHARLNSILHKSGLPPASPHQIIFNEEECKLILMAEHFSTVIEQCALEYDPSPLCNYLFHLAKETNSFLAKHSVLNAEEEEQKLNRLVLCRGIRNIIKEGLYLLGINAPQQM